MADTVAGAGADSSGSLATLLPLIARQLEEAPPPAEAAEGGEAAEAGGGAEGEGEEEEQYVLLEFEGDEVPSAGTELTLQGIDTARPSPTFVALFSSRCLGGFVLNHFWVRARAVFMKLVTRP